jgi:hypothetical protein
MAFAITHDKDLGYIRITVTGDWPEAIEQAMARGDLIRRGLLTLDTCVLIDLRGITRLPTGDEIRSAVAAAVAQETSRLRRALLVATPEQDAVARVLRELGRHEGAAIKIFREESAAVRWLTARQPV